MGGLIAMLLALRKLVGQHTCEFVLCGASLKMTEVCPLISLVKLIGEQFPELAVPEEALFGDSWTRISAMMRHGRCPKCTH